MAQANEIFATKQKPDNTIPRLEALEKSIANLSSHEKRIKTLEDDLRSLKNSLANADDNKLDTNAILMKIQLLSDDLSKKADKTECHLWIKESYEKVSKEWATEVERNRVDFDMFRTKDYPHLVDRVTKLEKMMQNLRNAFDNLKIPEGGNPENDRLIQELLQRV